MSLVSSVFVDLNSYQDADGNLGISAQSEIFKTYNNATVPPEAVAIIVDDIYITDGEAPTFLIEFGSGQASPPSINHPAGLNVTDVIQIDTTGQTWRLYTELLTTTNVHEELQVAVSGKSMFKKITILPQTGLSAIAP